MPATATMAARCTSIVIRKSQRKILAQVASLGSQNFARRALGVRSDATRPTATRNRKGERNGEAASRSLTAASQAAQTIHDWRGSGTSPVSSRKMIEEPRRWPQMAQRSAPSSCAGPPNVPGGPAEACSENTSRFMRGPFPGSYISTGPGWPRGCRSSSDSEVEGCYHHNPNRVDEVPVHLAGGHGEMLAFREVAADRADEADRQEEQTGADVCAVEAGDRVEHRAEEVGAGAEAVTDVLERLDAEECYTKHDSADQATNEAGAVAARDGAPGVVHREAAGEQDHGVDSSQHFIHVRVADGAGRRPGAARADAQVQVRGDQIGEKDRLGRDEEDHAVPAEAAAMRYFFFVRFGRSHDGAHGGDFLFFQGTFGRETFLDGFEAPADDADEHADEADRKSVV